MVCTTLNTDHRKLRRELNKYVQSKGYTTISNQLDVSSVFPDRKTKHSGKKKNTIPTIKHGWSLVMFWGCFAAFCTGFLRTVQCTMELIRLSGILAQNVLISVGKISLRNEHKHTAKNTQEWLKTKNGLFLSGLLSHSMHLPQMFKPIEHLWKELNL